MRSYGFQDVAVTDQEVARYEREIQEGLDLEVEVADQGPNTLEMNGSFSDPYEEPVEQAEPNDAALGAAMGRYLFEELGDYREDTDFVRPIFTQMETPLWEHAIQESGLEQYVDDTEQFRKGFVEQRDVSEELGFYQLESPEGLSSTQRALYDSLEGVLSEQNLTATEISDMASEGELDIGVKSAQYRSWINDNMNEIANKGLVGRFKDGRKVRFTNDLEEGFERQVINSDLKDEEKMNILYDREEPMTEEQIREIKGRRRQPREWMEEFSKRVSWEALN